MEPQAALFLRLVFNKFHPTKQDAVFKLLPEQEQTALKSLPIAANTPKSLLHFWNGFLKKVHYSWFVEPLKKLPEVLQPCVVASFENDLQYKLAHTFKFSALPEYPLPIKNFLLGQFTSAFGKMPTLPEELLTPTPLDSLLQLTKTELVTLIDLLAIPDIADEVRHIVDKKLIQAILLDLSLLQQKYLKQCLHQRSKIPTTPFNVKEAHKDKTKFLHDIHRRGLKRLATALSGIEFDFVWHVSHILDSGRGKIVMAEWQKEEVAIATQVIQIQIGQIIPIFKSS